MTATQFASLGISQALVRACESAGYSQPTPVQSAAIPVVLRGADLLALAPTGSGKTAAFALPLLDRLATGARQAGRHTRVLVLAPTRELAAQVGEVFRSLAADAGMKIKVAVLFGGVSVNPQMLGLRGGAEVVVATPGRLLDLLGRNALRLDAVETLVLDEADRLLDLGFAAEREQVLAALPPRRQTLFFSATFPPEVEALAGTLLRDAARVEAQSQMSALGDDGDVQAAPAITQRVIAVDAPRRTELLRHLVTQNGWHRVLVFVATRNAAQNVASKLYDRGLFAAPFHGDMSQSQRTSMLENFKEGGFDLLITTDLTARGIDVPGLQVVVNYDLPRSPNDYVHRIGRTGRAGESGLAVSFVSAQTEPHFRVIEKRMNLTLPREEITGFEPVEQPAGPLPNAGAGGIKGKRPSKKDKLRALTLRVPPAA